MENRKTKEEKAMHIRLVSRQNRVSLAQVDDAAVKTQLMAAVMQAAITILPLVLQLTDDKNQCECR